MIDLKDFKTIFSTGLTISFLLLSGCSQPVKNVENITSKNKESINLENSKIWSHNDFKSFGDSEFSTSKTVYGPFLYDVEREGGGVMVTYSLMAEISKENYSHIKHVVMVSVKYYAERRNDFSNAILSGGDSLRIQYGGHEVKCPHRQCEFSSMFAIHIPPNEIEKQESTRIKVSSENAMNNRSFVLQIPAEYKKAYRKKISMELGK